MALVLPKPQAAKLPTGNTLTSSFLASGFAIDATVTTPQPIFTVPAGLTVLVDAVDLHAGPGITAAQASGQTFGIQAGFDAGATNVLPAASGLILNPATSATVTFTATTRVRVLTGVNLPATTNGSAVGTQFGLPGQTFYIQLNYAGGNAPASGSVFRVGVLGHLASAP